MSPERRIGLGESAAWTSGHLIPAVPPTSTRAGPQPRELGTSIPETCIMGWARWCVQRAAIKTQLHHTPTTSPSKSDFTSHHGSQPFWSNSLALCPHLQSSLGEPTESRPQEVHI